MLYFNIFSLSKIKRWNNRVIGLVLMSILALLWWSFKPRENSIQSLKWSDLSNEQLSVLDSGELSLLTYNVAGLPAFISSAKTSRSSSIEAIGEKVSRYDIVNMQEDFNYHDKLCKENKHPYRSIHKGGVPFGDGLSTLSKFPMTNFRRIAWLACNGADCLTPKGFTYARVEIARGVFVDVYNVHATAQNDPAAVSARNENLNQLTAYMEQHSSGRPLIIMGDFNANYTFAPEKIKAFCLDNRLTDSWISLAHEGVFPVVVNDFKPTPMLSISDSMESIDKIYYRNSPDLVFNPVLYKVEQGLFTDTVRNDLSDHLAVSVKLKWMKR